MSVTYLLRPRDGFFCKDGRGWYTSASGRSHSVQWPFPSTIAGALRGAIGLTIEDERGVRLTGDEWRRLAEQNQLGFSAPLRRPVGSEWHAGDRMWPAPADAMYLREARQRTRIARLRPRPPRCPTLGVDDDPAREALWRPYHETKQKPLAGPAWWTDSEFVAWLCGEEVKPPTEAEWATRSPASRTDVRLALDPSTLTAAQSLLYSIDITEPLQAKDDGILEWALAIDAAVDQEAPDLDGRSTRLGGKGRVVSFRRLNAPELFAFPEMLGHAFDQARPRGLRLVVVNPCHFERGWLPDGFVCEETAEPPRYVGRIAGIERPLVLRAVLLARPQHVSGWDMVAGQPKPTRRLVPAGAVYFVEPTDGGTFSRETAESVWLAAIGSSTDEGYGRVVPGVWEPGDKPVIQRPMVSEESE